MKDTTHPYIYTINQYLQKPTFSSFLPGIAGVHGIPLWSFYVNRAQGIASFGVENKDRSIMEFSPANKSYERISSHGFRTFIKIDGQVYQPFTLHSKATQTMHIDRNILTIEEINSEHKLKITVSYFILPNESFGALVRSVDICNLGEERTIEIVDGMPEILPAGISTDTIKNMSFTARAWADVYYHKEGTPVYRTRHSISDSETVENITEAMFFVNIYKGKINKNIIIDKDILFEYCDDLSQAIGFNNNSLETLLSKTQYTENKYSSGFSCFSQVLTASGNEDSTLSFQSYYGHISSDAELDTIKNTLESTTNASNYSLAKKNEAQSIALDICNDIHTKSGFPLFDEYCKQNYLDNILRGGYPTIFPQKNGSLVYHIFSRKHGDLERDYNFFNLEAKRYSQGNGNFRDVCQNRRNDIIFNPQIGDSNVRNFATLIQADGYNPLVVKGLKLSIKPEFFSQLAEQLDIVMNDELQALLQNFTPGSLLEYAKAHNLLADDDSSITKFLETFLWYTNYEVNAVYGEGFWVDHFCYILDLIETYVDIYPEHINALLFDSVLQYFDSPASVRPRHEKYTLSDKTISETDTRNKLLQIGAVAELEEKVELAKARGHNFLVDEHNSIYTGTLFEKLFCLVANKVSSLDAYGIGIEMEANKPGWNDALNGMPGILGSGVSETFEVLRIVKFLLDSVQDQSSNIEKIEINQCIYNFAKSLSNLIQNDLTDMARWDQASSMREAYRETICFYMPSTKTMCATEECIEILQNYKLQLETGIAKIYGQDTVLQKTTALDIEAQHSNKIENTIPISFIENIASKYHPTANANTSNSTNSENYTIEEFTARALPFFLEAPAKSMKHNSKDANKLLYQTVKSSSLYDSTLKMYRTSESLASESSEIGRAKSFTPGWLERESIFMHMEFKYLLSLLEQGLYEEFYQDFFTALPCFMDPDVYGRSVLEASSFVVSSANSNPNLHGRGYSARLSGSTSEILSMWKIMCFGHTLFSIENNTLVFTLTPRLPASFFTTEGIVRCTLFSSIAVEIANPKRLATFEISPSSIECDGQIIEGNKVSGALAHKIRQQQIQSIKLCYN